jgi:hypothetical protein
MSPDFQNPCNSPMLRKLFRPKITTSWNINEMKRGDPDSGVTPFAGV